MTPDLDAVADAIAARFAAANVTPPVGLTVNIRLATADSPDQLGTLPTVLVVASEGEFETGNGTRLGGHDFLVRFYWSETLDLSRELASLRKWVTVLVDQLRDSVQLGGLVDRVTVDAYAIDLLTYARKSYAGIELAVHVQTSEPWSATA
jgi:hypothetical protein